ncbi:MAG: secretion protein [Bacteroidetes bacterium HGW-Bacteroidetes-1]|jgi:uncharacterized Ntn-hydrolase superfamily protein|nr:MAG: secretion protein [Bacteroidetes bacterium HGW-Bacteroidetes-1]
MYLRITIILLSLLGMALQAQDTFSIVAVDTVTGQIGSAGASCIDNSAIAGGARIISDIIPDRGAIHTQSYWLSANQVNARNRMLAGDSPDEIIDWLVANDAQNLPGRRQYGIVDFNPEGGARSAAFTGVNCMDWKGHITGANYAIQGNILLSEAIVDSIEARFLSTEGSLSDKLMSALQGANVAGADSRCLVEGVSSRSAFIRMSNPGNAYNELYLDLNVPQTAYGVEPIDSLQVLYDEWKMIVNNQEINQPAADNWLIYPNPSDGTIFFEIETEVIQPLSMVFTDNAGGHVLRIPLSEKKGSVSAENMPKGTYLVFIDWVEARTSVKKLVIR